MKNSITTPLAPGLLALALTAACGQPVTQEVSGETAQTPAAASGPAADAQPAPAIEQPRETVLPSLEVGQQAMPAALDSKVDLDALRLATDQRRGPGSGPDAFAKLPGEPVPKAEPAGPPAKLKLQPGTDRQHHFGDLLQGDRGEFSFQLISGGESDLVITRIKPSCGCTLAETMLVGADGERTAYENGQPIPPGTKIEIGASIKTEGRQDLMSSNIAIYSNDPDGVMQLTLKANVIPVLVAEPAAMIDFGRITQSDQVSDSVLVKSDHLGPFALRIDPTTVYDEALDVQVTPVDPNEDGHSVEWRLDVKFGPGAQEGYRTMPIRLLTDKEVPDAKTTNPDGSAKTYDLRVNVSARVQAMVAASPTFVPFGMVRPGEEQTRTALIRSYDEAFQMPDEVPITISGMRGEEFAHADHFTTSVRKIGDTVLELTINLEGMPEDLFGSFGGIVKLQVGHPTKDEVEVRFSGICRPGLPSTVTDKAGATQPNQRVLERKQLRKNP